MSRTAIFRLTLLALLALACGLAFGQSIPAPSINIDLGQEEQGQMSTSLQILALLTVLSVAPAILLLTTAFTRIVIVMGFVRTALGTQNIPPTQVIVGLSLFLTFFVMGPTYGQIYDNAVKPLLRAENPITPEEAIERASGPARAFMAGNTYESDLALFINMRGESPSSLEEVSMTTLIPAFIISELKTAFIIGFYIFVPFVIIDLIVASLLMGMGMMMMPPVVVSLPAKLLVFVLSDGWSILVQAVLAGYA